MSYEVKITKNVLDRLKTIHSMSFDGVETEATLNIIIETLKNNPFSYPIISNHRIVVEVMFPKLVYYIEDNEVVIFEMIDWEDLV